MFCTAENSAIGGPHYTAHKSMNPTMFLLILLSLCAKKTTCSHKMVAILTIPLFVIVQLLVTIYCIMYNWHFQVVCKQSGNRSLGCSCSYCRTPLDFTTISEVSSPSELPKWFRRTAEANPFAEKSRYNPEFH